MEHAQNHKLYLVNTLISLLAIINPQAILIGLTILSTCITVAHNGWKFYRDLKSKKQTP